MTENCNEKKTNTLFSVLLHAEKHRCYDESYQDNDPEHQKTVHPERCEEHIQYQDNDKSIPYKSFCITDLFHESSTALFFLLRHIFL
jgi:hypothetical protein